MHRRLSGRVVMADHAVVKHTMSMVSLVYISSMSRPLAAPDLHEILRLSRANNTRDDITGLLLYQDGTFIQTLEGPDAAVDRLYRKIRVDPRHTGVRTLFRSPLDSRIFTGWSMGFQNIDEIAQASREDFGEFLKDVASDTFNERQEQRLYGLLRSFKQAIQAP